MLSPVHLKICRESLEKKKHQKKLLKLVVVETKIYIHLYLLAYWVYTM